MSKDEHFFWWLMFVYVTHIVSVGMCVCVSACLCVWVCYRVWVCVWCVLACPCVCFLVCVFVCLTLRRVTMSTLFDRRRCNGVKQVDCRNVKSCVKSQNCNLVLLLIIGGIISICSKLNHNHYQRCRHHHDYKRGFELRIGLEIWSWSLKFNLWNVFGSRRVWYQCRLNTSNCCFFPCRSPSVWFQWT